MSFSVDLWNGTDAIKKQVFSVLKKIKSISKLITSYLAIETNYHKSLENLYKENKENINPENKLDESYLKIIDIFEFENRNRKILCNYINKVVVEKLNEYLRQPNTLLNKCFSDNNFNEEGFRRTLGILKDKQTNYWKDCKELAVLLAQNEIEEANSANDTKLAKTRNSRIKEKLNKLNLSKQEYIDCIKESNKEREKYNKKTEDILDTLQQLYMVMIEKLKDSINNFVIQRNDLLNKLFNKEKNEYENLHKKVDLDEELFNFIQNNATKEFPKRKFEFCPLKYATVNKNIKNKCNKCPESAFPKIYKAVKEYFENNKIFKEEIPFKITRKSTEFFNFFSTKKITSKDSNEIKNNEEKESKEFIETYITDLFNKNSSTNNNNNKKIEDNKDKNDTINKEQNLNENRQPKDNDNQKDNNDTDAKNDNKELDIKKEEKDEKEEVNTSNNNNEEISNNKQENDEQKEKKSDNNIINDDNKDEIKTNQENIDKNEIHSNDNCTSDTNTSNENKEEDMTNKNQELKNRQNDEKILNYFYKENKNFMKNVEILIKKLSFLRSKGYFDIEERAYNKILCLFFIILSEAPKNDYILKNILILAQTFYKTENNKKVYLQQSMKGSKIFSETETWHRVINYSMNLSCSSMDLSQTKEDMIDKINKEAAVIVVAYLCDIKQYTDKEDVFNKVKNYYVKVYNLDENMIDKEVEKYFISFKQKENVEETKNNNNIIKTINLNDLDNENFIKQRSYSIPTNILKNKEKTINNNESQEDSNTNLNELIIQNKEADTIKDIVNTDENKEKENEKENEKEEKEKENEIENEKENEKEKENNEIIIDKNIIVSPENKTQIINNNINIIKIEAKEVIIYENAKDKINIEQIKPIKKDENDEIKEEYIKEDGNKEIKTTNETAEDPKEEEKQI